MDKIYRVILSGLAKEEAYFKRQMVKLGVSEDISERIIKKSPVILKKGLSFKDAGKYADAIFQAGGKVSIQEEGNPEENRQKDPLSGVIPLKHFTMCPQCGYKQLKIEKCIRCGFVFAS